MKHSHLYEIISSDEVMKIYCPDDPKTETNIQCKLKRKRSNIA